MGTILQEKKELELFKYQNTCIPTPKTYQRTYQRLLFVCICNNKQGKGKTAEFWMKCVQLIHVYHKYSRRLREEDLHGYIFCLPNLPIRSLL